MKTLNDGTEVTDRSYHYLLDWNEQNEWKFIIENFDKDRLRELNKVEYQILFNMATSQEFPVSPNQPTILMLGSDIATAKDYLKLVRKVKGNVSSWDECEFHAQVLMPETTREPFHKKRSLPFLGVIAHDLPSFLTRPNVPIIEQSIILLKEVAYENSDYYVNKPKRRVRGEKNKEFKQSIKNLTNKKVNTAK